MSWRPHILAERPEAAILEGLPGGTRSDGSRKEPGGCIRPYESCHQAAGSCTYLVIGALLLRSGGRLCRPKAPIPHRRSVLVLSIPRAASGLGSGSGYGARPCP